MRIVPEGLLYELTGQSMPQPGNNRWGKAKKLAGGDTYTFVNTEMLPVITPIALQVSFSTDGVNFSPILPGTFPGSIGVTITKAVDVKSGAFVEQTVIFPGDSMPFCTLIAKALTVVVGNVTEAAPDIWVHVAACPVTAVDCESITGTPTSPWDDVQTVSFAANQAGVFVPILASTTTKQVIIQNNTATDLLIGFGSLTPSNGPPPVSNLILPGGIHAVWESQLGACQARVSAIFASVGSATEYATFSKTIHT